MPGIDAETGGADTLNILYKLNNVAAGLGGTRPERCAVASAMGRMWATFERTGRLAAEGAPARPNYDLEKRPVMYIDAPCRVVYGRFPQSHRV